jgi:hypothetical protein
MPWCSVRMPKEHARRATLSRSRERGRGEGAYSRYTRVAVSR